MGQATSSSCPHLIPMLAGRTPSVPNRRGNNYSQPPAPLSLFVNFVLPHFAFSLYQEKCRAGRDGNQSNRFLPHTTASRHNRTGCHVIIFVAHSIGLSVKRNFAKVTFKIMQISALESENLSLTVEKPLKIHHFMHKMARKVK